MRLLSIGLFSMCLALSTFAQVNSCGDPYWAETLRCTAFPAQVPQFNFGSVPAAANEVKTFTRVFLIDDPDVRCLDGTRPVIYVDPGVGAGSNNWIFTMTGGGSVAPVDTDGDGVPDDAQEVADTYAIANERDEMGTAFEPPMKNLGGVHSDDSVDNPEFATYNRVRIEKCSFDRFQGRTSWVGGTGFFTVTTPGGLLRDFDLYQQGYLIIQDALTALGPGLTYTTWSVDPVTGNVVSSQESLPPLSDAEKVLFIGHSGAAHGLFHNIDNLAAEFATYAPEADVRALFDANFLPSNENEVAFNAGGDAYDGVYAGTTIGALNTFDYDGAVNWPASSVTGQYETWGAVLDQSCISAHAAAGEEWKCNDRHHVMLNHIATPFFFREDFTDPNQEHTNGGAGHSLVWGDWDFYAHCPAGVACPPRLDVTEYGDRLTEQFSTMLYQSQIDSEMATGADPSLGAGNFATWYAWMPDCGVHGGAYDDRQFFDTTITYGVFVHTMRSWLEGFMSVSRTNLRGSRVTGWGGMFTTCPP